MAQSPSTTASTSTLATTISAAETVAANQSRAKDWRGVATVTLERETGDVAEYGDVGGSGSLVIETA